MKSAPKITILLGGWLTKRGHINRSWKVRWFEVTKETVTITSGKNSSNQIEYYLNYYENRTEHNLASIRTIAEESDSSSTTSTSHQGPSQTPLGRIQLTPETLVLDRSLGAKGYRFAVYNPPPASNEELPAVQAKVASSNLHQSVSSPQDEDDMFATEMVSVHKPGSTKATEDHDDDEDEEEEGNELIDQLDTEERETFEESNFEPEKAGIRSSIWRFMGGDNQSSKIGRWLGGGKSSYILFLSAVSQVSPIPMYPSSSILHLIAS